MSLRTILLFAVWISIVCGALTLNHTDTQPMLSGYITIALWINFCFYLSFAIVAAIVLVGQPKYIWTGCAVFTCVALIFQNLNLIQDWPLILAGYIYEPYEENLFGRSGWASPYPEYWLYNDAESGRRIRFARLTHLAFISVVSMMGMYVGSLLSRIKK